MIKIFTDRSRKTYTLSKADYKQACIFGTDEYYKLEEALKANPDYAVKLRTVNRKEETKSYKNLKYTNMEMYIKETDLANLPKYEQVKRLSKAQIAPFKYVRDWFLAEYPNYDDFTNFVSAREEEKAQKDDAKEETPKTTPLKKVS